MVESGKGRGWKEYCRISFGWKAGKEMVERIPQNIFWVESGKFLGWKEYCRILCNISYSTSAPVESVKIKYYLNPVSTKTVRQRADVRKLTALGNNARRQSRVSRHWWKMWFFFTEELVLLDSRYV